MLDVLAAIGIGAIVGIGTRALKDGVIINPNKHMPETLDSISKRNDEIFEGFKWCDDEVRKATYKCFSKGE